jgi:hypothetical protein
MIPQNRGGFLPTNHTIKQCGSREKLLINGGHDMRKLNLLTLTIVAGLFAWMVPVSRATPWASPPLISAQQTAEPAGPEAGTEQVERTFTGKIEKQKGKYVLRDTSAQVTYRLDDQPEAKRFNGHHVKVIGTLDTTTNTIHVSKIRLILSGNAGASS